MRCSPAGCSGCAADAIRTCRTGAAKANCRARSSRRSALSRCGRCSSAGGSPSLCRRPARQRFCHRAGRARRLGAGRPRARLPLRQGGGSVNDSLKAALARAARQQQFLEVLDRDQAESRFRRHLRLAPLGEETVPLAAALGRILARDVVAGTDVPGFDRASVDGFAVRAADTAGASEETPRLLRLNGEILTPGSEPRIAVAPGTASVIATGGMVPRGADAVVMVEHT